MCHLEHEPALSDAARTDHRHETARFVEHHRSKLGNLAVAADEAGHGIGQIAAGYPGDGMLALAARARSQRSRLEFACLVGGKVEGFGQLP